MLQGLEARMLGAVWETYKREAPHSGRSELLYGAYLYTYVYVSIQREPRLI